MSVRDICIGMLLGDGGENDCIEIWNDFLAKKSPIPYSTNPSPGPWKYVYDGIISDVYTYEIGIYSPFINELPYSTKERYPLFMKTMYNHQYLESTLVDNRLYLYKGRKNGSTDTPSSYAPVNYTIGTVPIIFGYILIYKNGEPLYANFQKKLTMVIYPPKQKQRFEWADGNKTYYEEVAYTNNEIILKSITPPDNITYLVQMTNSYTGVFIGGLNVDSLDYNRNSTGITNNCILTYEQIQYRLDGDSIEEAELVEQSRTERTSILDMTGAYYIGIHNGLHLISGLDYNSVYNEITNVMNAADERFRYSNAARWEELKYTPKIFEPEEA